MQVQKLPGLFPRARERVHAPAVEPVQVLLYDRREVLRGGSHVQEHGKAGGSGDFELFLEPYPLRLRVAELDSIVVEPALADRHDAPAGFTTAVFARDRGEGLEVRVGIAGGFELAASRRMHPHRREQAPHRG